MAIHAIRPEHGRPGAVVTLTGTGFTGAQSVSFGPGAEARFRVMSDTFIAATVPDQAVSGPVRVAVPGGSVLSRRFFHFLAHLPAIADVTPDHGHEGSTVVVTGRHFNGLSRLYLGGMPCPSARLEGDGRFTFQVPAGAATGLLTVFTNGRSSRSGTPFLVFPAPLVLNRLCPAAGGPGTAVVVHGSGFPADAQVELGGLALPGARVVSPKEIQVTVPPGTPPGATTLRVASPANPGVSALPFEVLATGPTRMLFVDGWHITQSTQTYDRQVPLVTGRDGFLRVFLRANLPTGATPALRAVLEAPGQATLDVRIPAPCPVPTAIAQGDLGRSWNLPIPRAHFVPGATLRLEVDPDHAFPEADRTGNAAALPLDVRVLKPLRITLVPVRTTNGAEGNVNRDGRTLADWTRVFRRLFPFPQDPGGLDVQVGTPLQSTVSMAVEGATPAERRTFVDRAMSRIDREVADKREAEGAVDRIYYGVIPFPIREQTLLGIRAAAAVGTDDPHYFAHTFAHEVGHALGLGHASCNVVCGTYEWPGDAEGGGRYRNGSIGTFGFDLEARRLLDPATATDIMGYCPGNQWLSDYNYRKVLEDWEAPR